MNVLARNNVRVKGNGKAPMLFAHGFGCDQNMWRYVAPAFEEEFQTILFDHVGAGQSDLSAYEAKKYSTLDGYADDMVEIVQALRLTDVIFVGHSVSAMMGIIAAEKAPGLFKSLVLVGPSPCYINEGDYYGGFTKPQIEELLEALDANHLGWSMSMAPVIMGNEDRKELGDELTNSFCRTDPKIAYQFARTTFLSDSRDLLPKVSIPSLILQCSDDLIAPRVVGEYVHSQIPDSTIALMKATGHCPNLSAPEETINVIKNYISDGWR
jgi:sigma-B regulation protein RsbQ